MGILPTPAEGQSFESAYAQAAELAEFVPVWGKPTAFYDLNSDLSGSWGKVFLTQYINENEMFAIINLSFMGAGLTLVAPPGMENATLSNPQWRQAYLQSAVEIAQAFQPPYLSLGNEVNRWYEKYGFDESDPNGFQNYVSLYEEMYAAVKAVSPQTKVYCTFAREIVAEFQEADLGVLRMFNPDKLDLLVFTSYPFAVQGINRPADIPEDYYSRTLADMPGKRMAFSELGWPSLEAFGGEEGQADFLQRAAGPLTLEQGVRLEFLGWAWLHDIDENDATGLIRGNGSEKQAYRVWEELSTSTK